MKSKIVVLYHLFYEDTCEVIAQELQALLVFEVTFLFNICSDTPNKQYISEVLRKQFTSCFIIYTSNKGKDIGAKLALFHLFLELQLDADYLLFLHDKKSLQALKSETWKEDLLKIISPKGIQAVESIFNESELYGVVATKEYIISEPFENGRLTGTNGAILQDMLRSFQIIPASFAFVGGTMFWARVRPFKEFFRTHPPLEVRKSLEDGNILDNFSGSVTHSWERILSWIATGSGYLMKGI